MLMARILTKHHDQESSYLIWRQGSSGEGSNDDRDHDLHRVMRVVVKFGEDTHVEVVACRTDGKGWDQNWADN